jgi:ABC-type Fe3+ transport system substrate-binding protein
VLHIWKARGESWTMEFLTKLFSEVRPQLLKEGLNALPELLAAGEFHAVVPTQEIVTHRKAMDGAPAGFTCPEPVPGSINEVVILRGTPNLHAAKLFVNWLLSREGQIAHFSSGGTAPIHKELRRKEFFLFADQVLGKDIVYKDPDLETTVLPRLLEFWNQLWLGAGGRSRER